MPAASEGYTLVELVVVMLLLGIIAIACESGLHFGAQVWTHLDGPDTDKDLGVPSQATLRSLLAHTLPRAKDEEIAFNGEPTAMDFDVTPPNAFHGGAAHASLRITHLRAAQSLELELQSIRAPHFKRRAILLNDAGTLRFSYLDMSGQSKTWLDYWRDRNRLPAAIRISSKDIGRWPTLIVIPQLVQSATCILDSEDLACRKI